VTNNRPNLTLDLLGHDGNVFVVINRTRGMLTGLTLQQFNMDIGQTTLIGEGTTYKDILAIVNKYVRLIDSSGTYPEYGIDEEAITTAVTKFNEELHTLPPTVSCAIDMLYPEFDNPEQGPAAYLSFVEAEISWTFSTLAQHKNEGYERLLAMLQELASALRSAGIESVI
jgi:hypothetical protein